MSARPLIDMPHGVEAYASIQALSVDDTTALVTRLMSIICAQRLEKCHARIILDRFGAALSESETRNDDQTGWDVVGDLVDRAALACDEIKTFDVPAMAREAARDFLDDERREQRRMGV